MLSFSIDSTLHIHEELNFDNGTSHQFILDTGSPINFMPIRLLETLKLGNKQSLSSTSVKIRGVSGHKLHVYGKCLLNVLKNGGKVSLNFYITAEGPSVLGPDGLRKLQIQLSLAQQSNSETMPLAGDIKSLI